MISTAITSMRARQVKERRRGFTLVEVLCSLSILAMLMLGVMDLYVGALRMESRAQADASGGGAGSNGLRQISECAREGLYYLLPQETLTGNQVSFTTSLATIGASGNTANAANPASRFSNYTAANFTSTRLPGGPVSYTGIFIGYPALTPAINVQTSAGATPSVAVQPYDATAVSTNYVFFFRSDLYGNPLPKTGSCLWETGTVNGATVDQAVIKAVDASSWNAIEFDRPVTSSTGAVIWNAVQAKIVTGGYSLQNGAATNDNTNGNYNNVTVGKTILLRDFDQSGSHNLNSNTPTNSTTTRFQGTINPVGNQV